MSNIPAELKYTKTHEWAKIEGDYAIIGISDHAQEALGDIVFVELPETGKNVEMSKECGVIESVKSASDLYSPLSGEVVAFNDALTQTPALLNSDPYGEGWLFKIKLSKKDELSTLMDANTYEKFLDETAH